MIEKENWIEKSIGEAKTNNPSIPDEAIALMKELLKTSLGEQQLTSKEVKSTAADLIEAAKIISDTEPWVSNEN